MRVVIRADASPSIGSGHLMRCLALAQALRDAGDEVTLASRAAPADPLLAAWRAEDVELAHVESEAAGGGDDAAATARIVRSTGASWLVVDGYDFDAAFRATAAGAARLAWIDDHGAKSAAADLIINGNLFGAEDLYAGSAATLAVGPRYALLRREFTTRPLRARTRSGVVLSMGGADPDGRTNPLLSALAARGIRGRVIVGPHHRRGEEVRANAARLGWDAIEAPDNMAAVLSSCALAVVGAGTTTLEAVALATPMVAVRVAENQRLVAATLQRLGLAAVPDGDDPASVADEAAALLRDDGRRLEMAHRARGVVDGRGARRVAGEMRGALLLLRPARMDDAPSLLAWRNDPATRGASFQTDAVDPADHHDWVTASLASPTRHVLIGELDSRPVGVVRLDVDGGEAVISATIAPEARGSGLAAPMLRQALDRAAELGLSRIEARIRPENEASRRAFAAAGFVESDERRANAREVRMFAATRLGG